MGHKECFEIMGKESNSYSRMDIPRHSKYMGVETAADVNISPAACINTMQKRMQTRTKS
jgi:hypothetical protein